MTEAAAADRRLVLVLGRRSGTSLFAGILGQLGFHVPQPEVRPDPTNPRGFSEPRWVVRFHTRLMQRRGVTVFDSRPAAWKRTVATANEDRLSEELGSWLAVQFVGRDNLVVKDPRLGWFVPLWLGATGGLGVDASFTTVLRHPSEVVKSARDSYGWQSDASAAAGWLNLTLHAERATRESRRAFVRYDDLLEAWPREVSRVGELLEIPWLVTVDRSRHPQVEAFVDRGLRRSAVGWDELRVPGPLRELVEQAWTGLTQLVEPGGDAQAAHASLDEVRGEYAAFYAGVEAIAQSSIKAAKRDAESAAPPSARPRRASGRLGRLRFIGGRAARLAPARQRRRVATLVESLGAAGLAGLPVRVAFLVPPRYRERVPLPLVRVGLRLVRRYAGR
jgi:hypothetical protein